MKSVNEQIMEIMDLHEKKWKRKDGLLAVVGLESKDGLRFYSETDFKTSLSLSKLLQQRLVDNGWEVVIRILNKNYCAAAMMWESKDTEEYPHLIATHSIDCAATEPAALFDLFCKCYGIKEE
jgi:hypothetical protein